MNTCCFLLKLLLSIICHCQLKAKRPKLKAESQKAQSKTNNELAKKLYALSLELFAQKKFRCLYRRCLPLPIPNREVKPARADGTAVIRGRVGRCQILKENLVHICGWGFFVYVPYKYTRDFYKNIRLRISQRPTRPTRAIDERLLQKQHILYAP